SDAHRQIQPAVSRSKPACKSHNGAATTKRLFCCYTFDAAQPARRIRRLFQEETHNSTKTKRCYIFLLTQNRSSAIFTIKSS
ncbi:MAG: hypothetical protein RQ723_10710, partial [Desulfuromonadales bacterium]|nr:hypothetical protein [Desulfuromonadales bacterium]